MKYLSMICLFFLALGGVASAETLSGSDNSNYAQLNLGSGISGNSRLEIAGTNIGSYSENFRPKPGVFTSGAVGHSYSNGMAAEVEVLYSRNDIKTDRLNALLGVNSNASAQTYGAMINGMYAISKIHGFVPYVGAGVGYGVAKYEALGGALKDNDSGVMWQLRAGASYPISPTAAFVIEYRYLDAPQYKLRGAFTFNGVQQTGVASAHTALHVLSLGMRYRF